MLIANHEIYHFNLPSKGCREAVRFTWKHPREDKESPEQLRLVDELKQGTAKYDTRQDKREIKERLKKIGVIKPHKVEFLIRDLLGDVSKDLNKCQREILQRLSTFISTGEDIIVDIRRNNGKVPKFDEFWSIVSSFIEDKTAEDDRRHSAPDNEESVVVDMDLAYSYADLFRQCIFDIYSDLPVVFVTVLAHDSISF